MCMAVYMFTNYVHANEINTRRPTTEIRVDRLTPRCLCPRREASRDFVWDMELFRIPGMAARERAGARIRTVWTKGLHIF
jgi:hypothetical protein